jgi:hypothetical protein
MAILVQSQGIISFSKATVAKVAMGLDHERSGASCLDYKGDSSGTGTVLGSWGDFFVGILVFVILSFFKEGIGNNLTMPSGSWFLKMGLGTWVRDF